MREFDFSEANVKRIKREYRKRRQALSWAEAQLSWALGAGAKGYREADRMVSEAEADVAKAQAAFSEIAAERGDYQARGFCR